MTQQGKALDGTPISNRGKVAMTLRFLRQREGWTTQDVADKIGISQSNYERIEAGAFAPNIDMLGKIARLYSCKVAIVPDTPQDNQ